MASEDASVVLTARAVRIPCCLVCGADLVALYQAHGAQRVAATTWDEPGRGGIAVAYGVLHRAHLQ